MKKENGTSVSILPWLTLAAVIWIQAIGSTNTDFAAYSSELKSRLNITQLKLNNLAVASDAGKLFGWISGFAAARLPLWSVLAIGSALGAFGYGIQFLFLVRKISSLSYAEFFLLNLLNGNSVCWLNTACYVSAMRQFSPADHGAVLGLTTSYSALTAKVYLALAHLVLGRGADRRGFLLLNAATPAVLGLMAMPTLAAMGP
ncbi:hypothetical protein HPP92_027242 [Vanilla planifolia]|uniref:Nodulin-like domain-containing protein n=1 Tax=Vanilla planifolia TaxID=51239 RepID=A0A835PBV7_VANPL|nr:hypothetical protein HPP92_027242 [Vanilla planifolia]